VEGEDRVKIYLQRLAVLLCVAGAALFAAMCIRGLVRKDQISLPTGTGAVVITSHPHHLMIVHVDPAIPRMGASWKTWESPIPGRMEYLEVRFAHAPGQWTLWLPHWLPILLLSAVPAFALLSRLRRRRLETRGLCTNCGYDLRASTDRCPECGAMIERMNGAPTFAAHQTPP
jgi:hypothetical protein